MSGTPAARAATTASRLASRSTSPGDVGGATRAIRPTPREFRATPTRATSTSTRPARRCASLWSLRRSPPVHDRQQRQRGVGVARRGARRTCPRRSPRPRATRRRTRAGSTTRGVRSSVVSPRRLWRGPCPLADPRPRRRCRRRAGGSGFWLSRPPATPPEGTVRHRRRRREPAGPQLGDQFFGRTPAPLAHPDAPDSASWAASSVTPGSVTGRSRSAASRVASRVKSIAPRTEDPVRMSAWSRRTDHRHGREDEARRERGVASRPHGRRSAPRRRRAGSPSRAGTPVVMADEMRAVPTASNGFIAAMRWKPWAGTAPRRGTWSSPSLDHRDEHVERLLGDAVDLLDVEQAPSRMR